MKYIFILTAVLAFIVFVASCTKDNTDYAAENEQEIQDFLTANNLTATATGTGLHYIITDAGNMMQFPTVSNKVKVYYKGYTLNGNVFDSRLAPNTPIEFPLSSVIKGWQEGIPLISKGGSARLFVPAHLGYGSNPPTSQIPANGVIVFDVDLLDFE